MKEHTNGFDSRLVAMSRREKHSRQAEWCLGVGNTWTPVPFVFNNLEAGASISETMEWFHLSQDQVTSVIEFAARSLDAPPSSAPIREKA